MKNSFYKLFFLLISILSLQSCVTNYVASTPKTYQNFAPTLYEENVTATNKSVNTGEEFKSNPELNESLAKASAYSMKIDQVLKEADTYIGTPYRYGGTSRRGIDCSAFVLSVYGDTVGINLPRVASAQAQLGEKINKENLQKGDLIFFSKGGRISHVGIVYEVSDDGQIKFIHASTSKGVMISSLSDSYWGPKYRFGKRILNPEENSMVN